MRPKTAAADNEFEDLAAYLKALRKFPPLSRQEEHVLALRVRMGDVSAKQKLVRHNLGFVLAVARKQRRDNVRLADLIQEGNLGLLRAVDKFDPHAGTRFLTYAAWWIRAHIGKYLREARSAVRPQSGTTAQPDLSLDTPRPGEEDSSHRERIEDDAPGPEAIYLSTERDRCVRELLDKVGPGMGKLGWDIVQNRLEQDSPETLRQIGSRWGVSRERARQIELKTKQLLRKHLRELQDDVARTAA